MSLTVYRYECRRIQLMTRVIQQRCADIPKGKRAEINLYKGGVVSAFRLLVLHVKIIVLRHTTDGAELRLAMGFGRGEVGAAAIRAATWWFAGWRPTRCLVGRHTLRADAGV